MAVKAAPTIHEAANVIGIDRFCKHYGPPPHSISLFVQNIKGERIMHRVVITLSALALNIVAPPPERLAGFAYVHLSEQASFKLQLDFCSPNATVASS
jgi:hypothetical protein